MSAVVWSTGFTGDFGWLDPAWRDATGQPLRHGLAGAVPGLWFVGLTWLTRRASGLFYGMPRDAETIAAAVRDRLAGVTHA